MVQPAVVFEAPADLPEDPAALQAILRAALAEIERLQFQLAGLQRNRFGRRSEKLAHETVQRASEDLEQSVAEKMAGLEAAAEAKTRPSTGKPPKRNRGALPAHLPRVEVIVDVEDKACVCCGGSLHQIGEDQAEMLDYVPAQFRVRLIRRPRYGCRACENAVVQAPAPNRPIDGGMATEALVAQVLIGKYGDHLPLYRQSQIFARQGIALDRSTLCNWVGRACWWLAPLHELMLSTVLSSPKVFADDTTLPVLDPGNGRTKTGRLWCYAVDNRPWQGPGHPVAAYAYSENRKAEHPASHLTGFRGLLQVDGYAGFGSLVKAATDGGLQLAFCWAHTIRTQSHFGRGRIPWRMPLQRDDMLDLQAIVVNDDTLDDQLQDSLAFDDAGGGLQPGADTLRESCQAGQHLLGLKLLRTQAKTLLMLLLCPLTLLRQGFALVG
jgi:transposase